MITKVCAGKKRGPRKLSICAVAENICARVFTLTLVGFSNKRTNTLRLDKVNFAALRRHLYLYSL